MQALSEAEIREITQKVGHPRAGHTKKPVDIKKVFAMRAAGFSVAQIAAYFDVSEATITRRLHGGCRRKSTHMEPLARKSDGSLPPGPPKLEAWGRTGLRKGALRPADRERVSRKPLLAVALGFIIVIGVLANVPRDVVVPDAGHDEDPPEVDAEPVILRCDDCGRAEIPTDAPAKIRFIGAFSKHHNGAILSGEATLRNNVDEEYRATYIAYRVNYSPILPGESVETDVCLTIFSQEELV